MSLLTALRHSPAVVLLRDLQARASSCCHAAASTSSSSSPRCTCSACATRGFSTAAASPLEQQQHLEQQQEVEAGTETLREIRARIFEQHLGDASRTGRKYLLRPLKGPAMQDWYMTDIGGTKPLLDDDMETQWVAHAQRQARRRVLGRACCVPLPARSPACTGHRRAPADSCPSRRACAAGRTS
jgi:hypothetical protein